MTDSKQEGHASVVVYSNWQCSSAICSFVFDLLFNLFRIALWPSVGKELSPRLFTCAVLFYCRLNCRCPFPVWYLGQDVEFDCIGS